MRNEKFALAARINAAAYLLDSQTPIDMALLNLIPRHLLRDCWQDLRYGVYPAPQEDFDWEPIDGWNSEIITSAVAIAKRQMVAHFFQPKKENYHVRIK